MYNIKKEIWFQGAIASLFSIAHHLITGDWPNYGELIIYFFMAFNTSVLCHVVEITKTNIRQKKNENE